ncbi:MAG: hypothetical protein GY708_12315 [Actinomycetia bacterium]|nr:hypothetical protein [Actinomycetes bacterium]MCP4959160.1 hypothetical protein [Actinomycetes bacterium]
MNADEIDALLERYRVAHSRIAANLVDLDDHRAYEMLSGAEVGPVTSARLGEGFDNISLLWSGLTQLGRVLDEAGALRSQGRPRGERGKQLEELLLSNSIEFGAQELESTGLDRGDRGLLESPKRSFTIDELLVMMASVYEPIRDAIAEIDAVWSEILPRLDAARTSMSSMREHLSGADEPAEVEAAQLAVDELDRIVLSDPLAIRHNAGRDLEAAVLEAARRVDAMVAERASLDDDLRSIDTRLAGLRLLRAKAAAAYSEAHAKILDPSDLVRVPGPHVIDGHGGLAERAKNLAGDSRAKNTAAGAIALTEYRSWDHLALALHAQLESAHRKNRAGLDTRDELRGRLIAYKAKASALAIAAVTHPTIADIAESAQNELFTAPIDLDRAADLVDRFAEAVSRSGGDPK